MTIKKEILDELIKDYRNPEDLLGENGLRGATNQTIIGEGDASRVDASTRLFQTRNCTA